MYTSYKKATGFSLNTVQYQFIEMGENLKFYDITFKFHKFLDFVEIRFLKFFLKIVINVRTV